MLLAVTIAEYDNRIPGSLVQEMMYRFPHTLLYLRADRGVAWELPRLASLCTGTVLGGHPLSCRDAARGSIITQETKRVFEGVSRLGELKQKDSHKLWDERHHSTVLGWGLNIK